MDNTRTLLRRLAGLTILAAALSRVMAAEAPPPNETTNQVPIKTALEVAPSYVLRPNDVIQVKVHLEDELTTQARISPQGTITMPMLGSVKVASNTIEQTATLIRDLLDKDYLVNPQVFVILIEGAKSRFTVLGQVQRPGNFEMPAGESLDLLQAIAMAGSYTSIGNPKKVTVQRVVSGEKKIFKLDAKAMAEGGKNKSFQVLPDDVITVGERWL